MKLELKSLQKATSKRQWSRLESVETVIEFERKAAELSQRQFSQTQGVPRSTLQYWLSRKARLDAEESLVKFMESPEGLAFLHRLMSALHFAFGKEGTASLHPICRFLELSGLAAFVASS